ncbi:hypothetical protein [Roseisalinus antarcticus]|uniref:Uncharacterized protein n=1 Tax=Roseisalinus antarcticus TaxID=254357 RepID=A0A1Y5SKE0_9RHOB|nr:hypothetical protein [Roseisalinus antarcticus]SLN39877.1 hypothetical protein ROA7023_01536 [Roseisalinus antarcticus]
MIYLIPSIGFLIGVLPGFFLARQGKVWVVAIFALALAVAGVWAIIVGRSQTGFDGMGYVIIAVLMLAPTVVGMVAGGLAGLYRRAKEGQTAPHDKDA